jgi:hypothetical protein
MDIDSDELWRSVHREGRAQAESLRRESYEQAVVAQVLKKAGRARELWRVRAAGKELLGESRVTLGLFHRAFEDFPLRLVATKLDLVELPLVDLFKRPTGTSIHQAYLEACQEHAGEQSVVLVFPWQGFGRYMTLHTLAREWAEPGTASRTKLVYAIGRARDRPTVYTVEDLDGVLDAIGWVGHVDTRECTVHPPRVEGVRRRRGKGSGSEAG